MIRLIQRRLIIPQGDTGTFTIPTQGEVEDGDKAVFSIFDNLTNQTVLEKTIDADSEMLSFKIESQDTINLEPDNRGSRYSWDVTLQRNPLYDENGLVHYDSVDSYYAAFGLPPCVIKKVTRNVQK